MRFVLTLLTLLVLPVLARAQPVCTPRPVASTEVDLVWFAPRPHPETDVEGTLVFRRFLGQGDDGWVKIATLPVGVTTYRDRGLVVGKDYEWTIQTSATDSYGTYVLSDLAVQGDPAPCVTVMAAPPPATCVPTPVATTTQELRWTTAALPPGYELLGFVLSRKDGAGPWVERKTFGPTSRRHTDTGLSPGGTYEWNVESQVRTPEGQEQRLGPALHGTPPPCVTMVEVPTNLTATASCLKKTLRLGWVSSAPTRSVRIDVQAGDGSWRQLVTTNGDHYLHEGVSTPPCYRFGYADQEAGWTDDFCPKG